MAFGSFRRTDSIRSDAAKAVTDTPKDGQEEPPPSPDPDDVDDDADDNADNMTDNEDDALTHITSQLMMTEVEESEEQAVSAYMTRQAQRAEVTGLSPMEEMRLAHGELAAKVAKKRHIEELPPSRIQQIHFPNVPIKKVLKRMHTSIAGRSFRNAPTVVCEAEVKRITQELASNMDNMTAEQAINFVQSVEQRENIIKMRVDGYDTKHIPWYLVSPTSKFRVRWDILCVFLVMYNCYYIPLLLAFGASSNAAATFAKLDNLQFLTDVVYILDVFFNFFSAFESRGRIETRWTQIVKEYTKTWSSLVARLVNFIAFLVDAVSAMPYEAFSMMHEDSRSGFDDDAAESTKYLRILKLCRLVGLPHILNRVEYALLIKSTQSGILKFFLLVCLTSHWSSCFFFFLSNGVPGGWVSKQGLEHKTLFDQYVNSFYWSIMTMTTVGYGDVTGQNTSERGFSIVAMVVGAWIFAYGITNVVAAVANLNPNDTVFQRKMDGINAFMERRDLPMELRTEIREFFFNARLSTENKLKNESKILSELSALLRSKIALAINDSVLNKMPFFEGADHNFLMELALSMKMVVIEGEIGQEMFFIFRGAVEVVKDNIQLAVLGEQQYFGEMAIMNTNSMRLATVRTLCFCELRMLTRQKFLLALAHYPNMRQRIAKIIHRRKAMNNQEMARRRSNDLSPVVKRNRKESTTPMENLVASIVQSHHRASDPLRGHKESDIFAVDDNEKIVGSTMDRISQMDVQSKPAASQDSMLRIIQALLEQQEVLAAEMSKLEARIHKCNCCRFMHNIEQLYYFQDAMRRPRVLTKASPRGSDGRTYGGQEEALYRAVPLPATSEEDHHEGSSILKPFKDEDDESSAEERKIMQGMMDANSRPTKPHMLSAYMARQTKGAHVVGLSPIEEMKLAQGEFQAKAATKLVNKATRLSGLQSLASSLHAAGLRKQASPPRKKSMAEKLIATLNAGGQRGSASVVEPLPEEDLRKITTTMNKNVEAMTPEQALNFVEDAAKTETMIRQKDEELRARKLPWYLIHPMGKFRLRWDVASLALLIYTAVFLPVSVMDAADMA
ncbi:unnamed protein product [Aphanomyces euteiches]